MEAVKIHGSSDQAFYPYKSHIGKYERINRPLISRTSGSGIFQAPPPFLSNSYSYPPYSTQQPPLLPLPAANPRRSAASHGLSSVNKKPNNSSRTRNRDSSLTPKKSKVPRKEEEILHFYSPNNRSTSSNCNLSRSSNNNKVVISANCGLMNDEVEMYSGAVVLSTSPPPSSLPLPSFSMRQPKLTSCKVEASAGIDAGATDNLRRLLRLP